MDLASYSQRLAYIVVRIAGYVRREHLRGRIEKLAFDFLELSAQRDYDKAITSLDVLESLLSFGKLIYQIDPIDYESVIKDLSTVKSEMRKFVELEELPNFRFNQNQFPNSVDNFEKDTENTIENEDYENGNAEIRQSEILEKVRKFGNEGCQIRDLVVEFGEVTERTLRNDLNKLLARDLIERRGGGGPGTSYVVKRYKT